MNRASGCRIAAWAGLIAVALAGCRSGNEASPHGPVLVLAAASTADAVRDIAADFTRKTGIEVRCSPDDSSRLAMQIVNGAPADLFLSANEKSADYLADQGLVEQSRKLLGNTLVLIAPRANPARIANPQDLANDAVKKVAIAGPTVPAGIYARQALKHLHLLDQLEKQRKIVPGENVRVTLAYVERGEVDAGIVYDTDARITDKVKVVAVFPPTTHAPIVYPLVLLKSAANRAPAREFYKYLQGRTAAETFEKYGFTRLGSD